jgi:transketolase
MRGLRPFAYTIATFALFRPYEIIRDDLCYQNLPVTVVGVGGGVSYSTLGSTHQAIEDIVVASSLPNMQVIAPCDPLEVKSATLWAAQHNQGPAYLRLARAGEPVLTEDAIDPWQFGKLRYLRKGSDVCIISYGAVMKIALEVADSLVADGLSVSVLSAHTLKPLDTDGIGEAVNSHDRIVVIEEMVPNGSLGSKVEQIAWRTGAKSHIDSFTLKDAFLHSYGSYESVLAAHGLSSAAILSKLTD